MISNPLVIINCLFFFIFSLELFCSHNWTKKITLQDIVACNQTTITQQKDNNSGLSE